MKMNIIIIIYYIYFMCYTTECSSLSPVIFPDETQLEIPVQTTIGETKAEATTATMEQNGVINSTIDSKMDTNQLAVLTQNSKSSTIDNLNEATKPMILPGDITTRIQDTQTDVTQSLPSIDLAEDTLSKTSTKILDNSESIVTVTDAQAIVQPSSTQLNTQTFTTSTRITSNDIVTPQQQVQTCICVPTGACNSTGILDGSGQLDIRIVTNVISNIVTPNANSPTITCQKELVICCQLGPYQCGVRYPPIVGSPSPKAGQSQFGEFPWQVAILGPGSVYIGSGALIDSQNVLTVAHRTSTYVNASNALTVRMGEWDATLEIEPIPPTEYEVSKIFLHPNFNNMNLKNDVAVLRLTKPVTLGTTPTVTTACLPDNRKFTEKCWIAGWGRNAFVTGTYQSIQKKVDVQIQTTEICQKQLQATRLGPSFQFDGSSFICAGGESGKDACTGDGGSPLVCSSDNKWYVTGLVSWGIGCGMANVPGVYVNVTNFMSWIKEKQTST